MTESQLRTELHKPYQFESWRNIIKEILPKTEFFTTASSQELFDNPKIVKKAFQFGTVELSNTEKVALIDVQLTDKKVISRNKVELRELASKALGGSFQGLLVLFHSPNQADYRLSFISKTSGFTEDGEYITTQTAPKRYTYVLGGNESCTTATSRLFGLVEKNVSLEDLTQAFNVEKLNNDFFKGYKEQYEKFWHYINGHLEYRDVLIDKEQTDIYKMEKPIRDFAKKLLGRIVFLYFLQKKGWLGVPANTKKWKGGDNEFIKNLFKNTDYKASFYSEYLVKLFFNTLNKVRSNDIFELTNTKVPYLNGGLFDNDMPQTNHFNFPENYFSSLFDFFGQYNFTIDENSPDDAEVGIDPEMLGHIFENLLEENQNKTGGIFYTPKAIVQYMCQESLIQYLLTHLETDNVSFEELSNFIYYNERGNVKGFVIKNARKIEELLDKVKVCDPAIGSGAFPMGILHEIFKAKMTLDLTLNPAETKRHIIQNSIYGVDLERGAVDIARLRFWLALVVDEDAPSPLPNLDYKIMQGNSLLESFEGVPLSALQQTKTAKTIVEGGQQLDMFGKVIVQQTSMEFLETKRQDLDDLMDSFFDADNQQKPILKTQINNIVHEHLHYNVDLKLAEVQTKTEILKDALSLITIYETDNKVNREKKQKALNTKQKALDNLYKEAQRLENALKTLDHIQETNERPYFLWHLFFKDVFEEGGFDIVIGNPPYIQLQQDGGYLAKLFEKENFKTFERAGDIYSLFYELGFNILKNNGLLSFITSNKWMRAGYGESLRFFFTENTNPIQLIDFSGQKIFENATVDTNILLYQKRKNNGTTNACIVKEKWTDSLNGYIQKNNTVCNFTGKESWVILNPIEQRIKEKIERIGIPLKDWDISIYRGVLTGYNEAFIIDGKKKAELISADPKSVEIIRPILRGRDIKRYGYEFADLWLINTHNGVKEKGLERIIVEDYPAIKKHLDISYSELEKRTDKGDTPYNLRNCTYIEDFFSEKIIWAETMRVHKQSVDRFPRFSIETDTQHIIDKTCFFATGKNLKLILAILNSKIGKYLCSQYVSILDDGGYLMQKFYIEKIPMVLPSLDAINELEELVSKLILDKVNEDIENLIDNLICQIYELNYDEIQFIDNQ